MMRAAWAGVLVIAIPLIAEAQACAKPAEAVRYRERRDRAKGDRELRTTGFTSAAVDIDSRIDIEIDVECLRNAVGATVVSPEEAARATLLAERLRHLRVAAQGVDSVVTLLQLATDAHARDAPQPADRHIASFAAAAQRMFQGLGAAMTARLIEEQLGPLAAAALTPTQRQAQEAALARNVELLSEPFLADQGYDFEAIRSAFAREIALVERDMRGQELDALSIEIQAHFVDARGRAIPIRLPRYNDAAAGPDTRFQRMNFGVSEEQTTLYARYDSLAKTMKDAQSIGEALTAALRVEWEAARPEVDRLVREIKASVDTATASATRLRARIAQTPATQWLASLQETLQRTEEGRAVLARWGEVATSMAQLLDDFRPLGALGGIAAPLAVETPHEAVNILLASLRTVQGYSDQDRAAARAVSGEAWRVRAEALTALRQAVEAYRARGGADLFGPGGPLSDVSAIIRAGVELANTLDRTARNAQSWLARAFGGDIARAVADLPVPPGQRRLPMSGDVNTSMNLRSIPAQRSEGDVVRVSYAFHSGEQQLSNGWTDDFQLRSFGGSSRAIAGLAFVRQSGGRPFSPTASLSWLTSYRGWPTNAEPGLGGTARGWGVGFSTMSVNFEEDQNVQIGIGLTVATIDDRLLLGYGYNLQGKENPWFGYFSIRLFSTGGALGGSP